jgi:enoyl-CoA hydratase
MALSVTTSRRGRILLVQIDREAKRNALNAAVTEGLDAAMNELEDDGELWCGVLTGGTRVFSAGVDLATGPGAATERGGQVGLIHRVRTKPLIAAVEGFAVGGGLELVLCCDLVVAARTAEFGLPEVTRGLMPDFGGAFRAARALPLNIARELLLTGANLSAERAERLGFVNRLTDPGDALAGALGLAEQVCANAPLAVREVLGLVNREVAGDETASWERSDAAHGRLVATEDVKEGIEAFFARRPPQWSGR